MIKGQRSSGPWKPALVVLAGLLTLAGMLALSAPAQGDLSLVSTSPADGDTEVDTLMTLIMQFSAPLDTTARFEEPGDLFLGLEAFPFEAVGEPQGEITLSPDSTTVTIEDIPLEPDRAYLFVLTGARSASGEMLDRPYVLAFSTGSALPQGTVSGTISFPGDDPGGTAVGLFIDPPFGEGDDEDGGIPDLWGGAVVPLSSSDYTMPYVPAGSYYVIGFHDTNRDGNFLFPGDAFGGYDADGDSLADKITITAGQSLTGIDVTIGLSPQVTARENFAAAGQVALSQFADAQPSVMVAAPISEEGTSENWMYGFYSAAGDTLFGVTRVGETFFVFTFPIGDGDDGPSFLYDIELPENWIDSDMAADTAEVYVGEDFRDQYPDAEIVSFAATFAFPEWGGLNQTRREPADWSNDIFPVDEPDWLLFQAPVAGDTFQAWVFSYYSEEADEDNGILIDILTGEPIELPGPGEPTAARENLGTADATAAAWAPDAALVTVGNADNLEPDGSAWAWGYAYYSASKDSVLVLFIVSDIITSQEAESTDVVPSLIPLPSGWLDSPAVTAVAEAASGGFRSQHSDAWVTTQVAYGLRPDQPSRAVWRFIYQSTIDMVWLFIYVDALTGEIVTAVGDAGDPGNQPGEFSLEPNYPNPFNAETVIGYGLPHEAHVELAVYNILGQRARTLVNRIQSAGSHQIRWDGTDDSGRPLASGLYFYRMRVGESIRTRKTVLMR
jgi:hypothetical protein